MGLTLFGSKLVFAGFLWLIWMISTFVTSTYSYYKGMYNCAEHHNSILFGIKQAIIDAEGRNNVNKK